MESRGEANIIKYLVTKCEIYFTFTRGVVGSAGGGGGGVKLHSLCSPPVAPDPDSC